jgi:hypothetical protein
VEVVDERVAEGPHAFRQLVDLRVLRPRADRLDECPLWVDVEPDGPAGPDRLERVDRRPCRVDAADLSE